MRGRFVTCIALLTFSITNGCSAPYRSEQEHRLEIPTADNNNTVVTSVDLLRANIRAAGGDEAWRNLKGIAMETELQSFVANQLTAKSEERLELDMNRNRWRTTSVKGDAIERVTIGDSTRSEIYKYEQGQIVGSTGIQPEAPSVYKELQLVEEAEDWTVDRSTWQDKEHWSLTSKDGSQRRIYDLDSFLLSATVEMTPYGSSETIYSDYRKIGRCLFPFSIRSIFRDSSFELAKSVIKIEVNPSFDDRRFEFEEGWRKVKTGMPAPDFMIPDFFNQNKTWSNETLHGKVVLIDFWATWCGPCIKEFPELKDISKKYLADDLIVLAISFDSDKEQYEEFVKSKIPEWSHALVENGFDSSLAKQFEIASIPRTILLDRNGVILGVDDEVRGKSLHKRLGEIFSE
ncbi:TlpA family protein disulfide reductase [Pirellulaceae bacterium SH449]